MKPLYLSISLALIATVFTACEKSEISTAEPEKVEARHDENIVSLSRENLEHVQIQTKSVALGNLEKTLKATGRVAENANKTAKISSTLEGKLLKLNHDINDRVKAGDVLALVQSPELLGRPLEIKAPIDGVIVQREKGVGELVGKDTTIYTISDPSDLWVIAEVKERDLGLIQAGQEATFKVLPYPDHEFRGKIVRLGHQLEADTRTLEVRLEADNADGRLKPGMFADVEITTTILKNILTIPDTAVQSEGEESIVFTALGENRFEKRVVQLGMEQRGQVEVLKGLKPDEEVVTNGSFILKSEMLKGELGEE